MIIEKGDCLTPYQLERVETVLAVIRRLKDYLNRGKVYQNSLAYYDENLDQLPELCDEIRNKIRSGMADNFCTFRNGRICVPVKKEHKLKVSGAIIDKSATGSTLFIELAGVTKYYEKLQLLKIDEENEVYRILYTLLLLWMN